MEIKELVKEKYGQAVACDDGRKILFGTSVFARAKQFALADAFKKDR